MTPEALDEARAREAHKRFLADDKLVNFMDLARLAISLVRTGWEPVDPDLIEAREICAAYYEGEGAGLPKPDKAARIRDGKLDSEPELVVIRTAIKRGRQLAEGSLS